MQYQPEEDPHSPSRARPDRRSASETPERLSPAARGAVYSMERELYGDASRRARSPPEMPDFYHRFEPRMSKPFNLRPDPYDGSEEWDVYQEHFECCASLGGWTFRDKTLALAALLRGPARKFYMGLNHREKNDYNALVDSLRQRFGCQSRHQIYWTSKFDSRFRLPGESAASLADDLLLLARRAHPELNHDTITKLALQQFYKSLEPELRWRCIEGGCSTLSDAVDVLDTYETIMKPGLTKKSVRMVQDSASASTENVLQKIMERLESLESTVRGDSKNRPQLERTNGCYVCSSTEHYFKQCPMYTKSAQLDARRNRYSNNINGTSYRANQSSRYDNGYGNGHGMRNGQSRSSSGGTNPGSRAYCQGN